MDNKEQLSYVEALELERVKMLVFQRELPLSIELVSRGAYFSISKRRYLNNLFFFFPFSFLVPK